MEENNTSIRVKGHIAVFKHLQTGKFYLHVYNGNQSHYAVRLAGEQAANLVAKNCELEIQKYYEWPSHIMNVGGMK